MFKFPSTSSHISNVLVKEMKIENSAGVLLASVIYNEELSGIGEKLSTNKISLGDTKKYYSKDSLKMKLDVSYTKESLDSKGEVTKTENKIETLTASLGRVEIINPNFDVE